MLARPRSPATPRAIIEKIVLATANGNCVLILSSCSYSLGNRGDRAMLEGLVRWLNRQESNLRLIAYAYDPAAMRDIDGLLAVQTPEGAFMTFHGRLPGFVRNRPTLGRLATLVFSGWLCLNGWLYRGTSLCFLCPADIRRYLSEVRDARAVVLSGGGYLNSVWWLDGLYSKAWLGILGKVMGRSLLLTSQGIGPLDHWLDRFVAGRLFRVADFVGVRDMASADLVKKLSGTWVGVAYSGDDGLLGDGLSADSSGALLQRLGISRNRRLIAVNFRDSAVYAPGYTHPNFNACAAMVDRIVELTDSDVIFVPISYHPGDDDRESAARVRERMRYASKATIITEPLTPLEIRSLVGQAFVAIGSSYHFLRFALGASVPALGVYQNSYYRTKLLGLFELYGIAERCTSLQADSEAANDRLVDSLVQDLSLLRALLNEANSRLDAQSAKWHATFAAAFQRA
jgi:polysaccharide pyruvyl transferase WcaK-like protein